MDKARQILEEYLKYYENVQIMASKSEEIKNRILSIEEAIAELELQEVNMVYTIVGQTQITNFIMQVFSTKEKAEDFIALKTKEGGWDYSPYIETHKLN